MPTFIKSGLKVNHGLSVCRRRLGQAVCDVIDLEKPEVFVGRTIDWEFAAERHLR